MTSTNSTLPCDGLGQGIWIGGQTGIVEALYAGHFLTEPGRSLEALILVRQLDLGNDKTGICALENVDLPNKVSARHLVANFLDERASAQGHELAGLVDGYGEFVLLPAEGDGARFDGQRRRCRVANADTNRNGIREGQIGLLDQAAAIGVRAPTVISHQEFALYFLRHGRSHAPTFYPFISVLEGVTRFH